MTYRNEVFRTMARDATRDAARAAPSYFEHNAQQAERARRVANIRRTRNAVWRQLGNVARLMGADPRNSCKGCA